jgi:hypothetical protein
MAWECLWGSDGFIEGGSITWHQIRRRNTEQTLPAVCSQITLKEKRYAGSCFDYHCGFNACWCLTQMASQPRAEGGATARAAGWDLS